MFAVVKNINFCTNCLGRNDERILGHVSCSVNLPIMIYLLNNLYLQEEYHKSEFKNLKPFL